MIQRDNRVIRVKEELWVAWGAMAKERGKTKAALIRELMVRELAAYARRKARQEREAAQAAALVEQQRAAE